MIIVFRFLFSHDKFHDQKKFIYQLFDYFDFPLPPPIQNQNLPSPDLIDLFSFRRPCHKFILTQSPPKSSPSQFRVTIATIAETY